MRETETNNGIIVLPELDRMIADGEVSVTRKASQELPQRIIATINYYYKQGLPVHRIASEISGATNRKITVGLIYTYARRCRKGVYNADGSFNTAFLTTPAGQELVNGVLEEIADTGSSGIKRCDLVRTRQLTANMLDVILGAIADEIHEERRHGARRYYLKRFALAQPGIHLERVS
jgi:hypothetical protein